jgi:tRNA A37 threonylcarbamoyladenosine synthetase subunit TsaC/SUA5/YrdC
MPLHNRIANISGRTKTTAIKSILSRTQRERERERERGRRGGGEPSHVIDHTKAHSRLADSRRGTPLSIGRCLYWR